MTHGCDALTEKEKQTLRLIVRGHDAKSTARELGLSVHTINERLRDARRKLAVSSSREAARKLLDAEGTLVASGPQLMGDTQMGADPVRTPAQPAADPGRWWLGVAGVIAMSFAIGILAFTLAAQSAAPPAAKPAQVAALEAEVTQAARDWLALVDAGQWDTSWRATGSQFRDLNTVEQWTNVSQHARVPLGAMLSREALTHDSVPAPPRGLEMVRFRTSFAGRDNVIETLTLAREDETWRVVGYWID